MKYEVQIKYEKVGVVEIEIEGEDSVENWAEARDRVEKLLEEGKLDPEIILDMWASADPKKFECGVCLDKGRTWCHKPAYALIWVNRRPSHRFFKCKECFEKYWKTRKNDGSDGDGLGKISYRIV